MDFSNLLSVQYTLKYDQNKLQQVLKQMASKINETNRSIRKIDGRTKILEEYESSNRKVMQIIKNFTIQNTRLTVNQFKQLKNGLEHCLGQTWTKYQTEKINADKSQFISSDLQNRISGFTAQTKQLSKKVSQLKQQIVLTYDFCQQQTNQVKNVISDQQKQIKTIKQAIRIQVQKEVNKLKQEVLKINLEKFQLLTKQLRAKIYQQDEQSQYQDDQQRETQRQCQQGSEENGILNSKPCLSRSGKQIPETYKKLQQQQGFCKLGNQKTGPQDISTQQRSRDQIQKAIDNTQQHDGVIQQKNQNQINQGVNKSGKRKANGITFAKQPTRGTSILNHMIPEINTGQKKSKLGKVKKDKSAKKYKNLDVNGNSDAFGRQQYSNYMTKFQQQIKTQINNQIVQFKSQLDMLLQNNHKFSMKISALQITQQQVNKGLQANNKKITDLQKEINHMRNNLYDNMQKTKQVSTKCTQHSAKITFFVLQFNEIKRCLKQIDTQFQYKSIKEFKEFKDLTNKKNPGDQNNIVSSSNHGSKTAIMSRNSSNMILPNLKDQSPVIHRLNLLTQKIAKIQQKLKYNTNHITSQKNLPKIDSSNNVMHTKSNIIPSVEILKKQIQATNQQLNKTNQRLTNFKKNLKQLQSSHSLIPKKLQTLQTKINNVNQIQQDRLLELIKQLINRVLTDPFNNHFTNGLKKEIHVKFLQIKHEYASIWKDIQFKVTDRASTSQIAKLKDVFEHKILQAKSLINKKAEQEDFKKATKYLQGKLKELYQYVKGQEQKSQSNKKYYMGRS